MDEYLITLDFQSTGIGSERSISGVIKTDGIALVRFQISKERVPYEDSIGGWSVKLTEINSQEILNIDFHEETKAARLGGIALLQLLSEWLPMAAGFPDKSQLSSFVDTGTLLEFNLTFVNPVEINHPNRDSATGSHSELQRDNLQVWKLPKAQAF